MPNGDDKSWVRICAAIDGFRMRFGRWPTCVRTDPHVIALLRGSLLTPEQIKEVEAKIIFIPEHDVMAVAEDQLGGSYNYDREGFSDYPKPSTYDWFGLSSSPPSRSFLDSEVAAGLSGHRETLAHWANALRGFAPPRKEKPEIEIRSVPGWNNARRVVSNYSPLNANLSVSRSAWFAASTFVSSFLAMSMAEGAHLARLYQESRMDLTPLSDPLDVAFSLHRQLSSSREEVYSDWLQWVLQHLADPTLIKRVLNIPNMGRSESLENTIAVEREKVVERGHQDQSGRLDIVITQGTCWLAVIEVKTNPYSEWDLKKHLGYREAISDPETDLIFLSVNPPDADLFGFRFLSWADLCVALREVAPSRLDAKYILGTSLMLAFVGAVEQNLLGFVWPTPLQKIPRMVNHLEKAARAGARRQ